ncbi:MAG: FAD-dependent oxidoreductase [Proteobacteria bacterium]|nr:MAG: FAD-dependent oxidoreductase [Pseudomonadota bacterium]
MSRIDGARRFVTHTETTIYIAPVWQQWARGMEEADFLIIGAGIAGASAGYGLASHGRVLLLEQEAVPGYHTTGRSAAFFAETYGNEAVRRLTTAAKDFFLAPPDGFADGPLVRNRGALFIAGEAQLAALDALYTDKRRTLATVTRVDARFIAEKLPLIRPRAAVAGVWDPECRDIDVHALHQGFLRGLRRRGGRVLTHARVTALEYANGRWRAACADGREARAPVVVNAAGAWGDKVAAMAGVKPVGLVAKRRTVIIIPAPPQMAGNDWPLTLDVEDKFYLKPESGRILASPGDATPMEPQDVQPDEMDVANAVHRLEAAFDLAVERVERKWAGLRTFAPDETPVVGADPMVPNFYWFVGQGGFGMQTAPALSALIEGLVIDGQAPASLQAFGVEADTYAPGRFSPSP